MLSPCLQCPVTPRIEKDGPPRDCPPNQPCPLRKPGDIVPQSERAQSLGGPGTELTKILASLDILLKPTCSCRSHAREMDRRGRKWCEENVSTIVGWLEEEWIRQRLGGTFDRDIAASIVGMAIDAAK